MLFLVRNQYLVHVIEVRTEHNLTPHSSFPPTGSIALSLCHIAELDYVMSLCDTHTFTKWALS